VVQHRLLMLLYFTKSENSPLYFFQSCAVITPLGSISSLSPSAHMKIDCVEDGGSVLISNCLLMEHDHSLQG
jgi:hypothetical protein